MYVVYDTYGTYVACGVDDAHRVYGVHDVCGVYEVFVDMHGVGAASVVQVVNAHMARNVHIARAV
eukprot:7207686-Lingulodinium_polyedra.AAC.1